MSSAQPDKRMPWRSEEVNDIIGDNMYHDGQLAIKPQGDKLNQILTDFVNALSEVPYEPREIASLSCITSTRERLATHSKKQEQRGRILGIIEALQGVSQQHYGYKGELVVDTYLSLKDRLRPVPEEPGFSLPVQEAIKFYEAQLTALEGGDHA